MQPRILIVDDEKNIRRTLSMILTSAGYAASEAATGEEGLAALGESAVEVVLLDISMPGMGGIETLRKLQSEHPGIATIMISGQATVANAVEATRLGAFDFLEKPLSKERVLLAVRNAVATASLGREVRRYRTSESARQAMVGESPALETLRRSIQQVGPSGATVLITGESGTGKELVARAVHEASPRKNAVFVKVNCAAIPEDLIETELFGCVRGAFTGADRTRDGRFLLADGGTLFLDEIGDMSLRVQAKVLRALQEGEFERVGDTRTLRVDVRVVAATNKDLPGEVASGRFREDLFYRLNVVPLAVPPLRERREDIPRIATHFLKLHASENDLPDKRFSRAALEALARMDWPGNIRELRNVVERLAILSDAPEITAEEVKRLAPAGSLGARTKAASGSDATGASSAASGSPSPSQPFPGAASAPLEAGVTSPTVESIRQAGGFLEARREFERRCVEACLDRTGGNVSEAARLLGIERSNLHKKMVALGLEARPPRTGERQRPDGERHTGAGAEKSSDREARGEGSTRAEKEGREEGETE